MKKFIALMAAFCVWAVNSQFVFADAWAKTTFNSYDEVLDEWDTEEGIYYTVVDIDGDGIAELMIGYGEQNGYCTYGRDNDSGKIIALDDGYFSDIAFSTEPYLYNNEIYYIEEDPGYDFGDDAVELIKITRWGNAVNLEVVHRITVANDGSDYDNAVNEMKKMLAGGKELEFLPVTERSLLAEAENTESASVQVILNGERLYFEKSPQILSGRTLVPLRAIFEAMGASVAWDNNSQTVTSVKDSTVIKMTIGSSIMYKNGSAITLDVPPQLIDGYTMVPARAVAEAFGASVSWDGDSKTVYINN